jgi:hypothetical protein
MKTVLICLAALFFAGCATAPENIPPAYISEMSYMNYTCEQLAQEQERLASALASTSKAQRQARTNDTWGVILIGLPTASLSGSNVAAEVARLKGELQALQKAGIMKNCNLPKPSDPDPVKRSKAGVIIEE